MTTLRSGHLDGGDGHRIYFEVSGRPDGIPVLVVHGGPGAPPGDDVYELFDAETYRVIVCHQRGCGKSTPAGELRHNTTEHLLQDMELLRRHLEVDRWLLLGGSWGTTLALVYAIRHPERVLALVLRGTFLCRDRDIRWLYESGANQLFPDSWARFRSIVPEDQRHDLIGAYSTLLHADAAATRALAASHWSAWEGSMVSIEADGRPSGVFTDPAFELTFARLGCHYLGNRGFLAEDYILGHASAIRHIPTALVTGRFDVITPPMAAYELYAALDGCPHSSLSIVTGAAHSTCDEPMRRALREKTTEFASLLRARA